MELQKEAILAVNLSDLPLEEMLSREWLLTNSRGGFAFSTLAGCNTRRYHGLLIGTPHPPAARFLGLAACLEKISLEEDSLEFSCFEFDRTFHPKGYEHLTAFSRDIGVHFEYELGLARCTKSVYLHPTEDIVAVEYAFSHLVRPFTFSLLPLAAMRDFHGLQNAVRPITAETKGPHAVRIAGPSEDDLQLHIVASSMAFRPEPHWWYRFYYRIEAQRGQDCFEDLWTPGWYSCRIEQPGSVILWAALKPSGAAFEPPDFQQMLEDLSNRQKDLCRNAFSRDPIQKALFISAGQFMVERTIQGRTSPTILAGYPWFLDWGRDAFIALPGLCLSTGRADTAAGVLQTFAEAVSEGMIPNRFDDYGGPAHYNSIDASLWFVEAAYQWLQQTQNDSFFEKNLLPAVLQILNGYQAGTRFGIHADVDGLITGGDPQTQLTWMDAKCGDVVFTPRYGKAVEINALWYDILCRTAEYFKDRNRSKSEFFTARAELVKQNFSRLFWNEHTGCLNDCILPDGTPDPSIRPNQIFAVSLLHSPLSANRQKRVVQIVQQELLTPYGLRTLSPRDPRYIGRYEGDMFRRDAAYHQGTVWPWLMGAFLEAFLKVHNRSPQARKQTAAMLSPLIHHFANHACLGSISEIFDGDAPHYPRGCPAQAWSVAEVLRVWLLLQQAVSS
ncbi:MAG TPA: amylo-alpha-1,6-glucosidase [Anaerohalosphaeraceae bacterium]|nr:amylo-alpha-1,6-glucosidase [Anaerohalosphaeraceae bacterium]